jgi:tetratricopeptide (TPR) repeat protein
MTQQVLYASLLRADLERFHQAVGFAIEQVYGSDLDTQYERLAKHFCQGKARVRGVAYSMQAGRSAVESGAVREALTYYDWADEMLQAYRADGQTDASIRPTRGVHMPAESGEVRSAYLCTQGVQLSLVLERARVLWYLLDISKAKSDLERAVALAVELADLGLQGKALFSLAEILYHEADYGQAVAVARRAVLCFAALGDHRRQARAWRLQSRIHDALGQPEAALQCVVRASSYGGDGTAFRRYLGSVLLQSSSTLADREAGARLSRPGTAEWSLTIEEPMWSALVAAYSGEWGHGLKLARVAIAAGWALGTPLDVADAKCVLACVLTRIGAFAEAGSHLDEAMATYLEAGWKRGQISGLVLRGQGLTGLGQKERAKACFEQALAYGKETHSVQGIVGAQIGLGRLLAANHEWCKAERLCVEARARARRARLGVAWIGARLGLARIYLAQERWAPARMQAAQASASSKKLRFRDLTMESAAVLGQAWLGMGELDRARACLEEREDVARQLAGTLPPAYASRFRQWGSEVGRN